jgi:hypothetical protein
MRIHSDLAREANRRVTFELLWERINRGQAALAMRRRNRQNRQMARELERRGVL